MEKINLQTCDASFPLFNILRTAVQNQIDHIQAVLVAHPEISAKLRLEAEAAILKAKDALVNGTAIDWWALLQQLMPILLALLQALIGV
jgi:hypothetical protein